MLDVPHHLGLLLEDPDNLEAIERLRAATAAATESPSHEAAAQRAELLRLVGAARRGHQERGETWTAAQLLDLEARLSSADPDREAALQKELGRLCREELLDDERARVAFERAEVLRPGDEEVAEALEQLSTLEKTWKDIAKRFFDEAEEASEGALRTSLLVSAGILVSKYKKKGRDKDVDRLFGEALSSDPGDVRAVRAYEQILRKREQWPELATVLLNAAERTKSRDERVQLYLRSARVLARKVPDAARAAEAYQRVLDFAPGQPEALRFLVEHFTQKSEWDHLVALYDDALRGRQKLESEQGILLQIGMVHWRFRNAPNEAEPYFARLRKVDPAHPGMLAFYREHYAKDGEHAKLLAVLSDAQRITTDPQLRTELAIEVARAAEHGGAVDRAIDAWKAVQRSDPRNAEAAGSLRDLYRQSEKWNALVELLKSELDSLPPTAVEARVALWREMVEVYRERLHLDVMVIHGWNAILQLVPDDAEALDALARTYEQMGRWNDLIQVLQRKAEVALAPADQVALYMRIARLWIERFANYNQATRPLELVIERDPHNREALRQLKDIYGKKRAWKQLFDVQRAEAELASDPDARHKMRIELAKVAGERLHRHADAIALYKEVLAHEPSNTEALDNLEKLAEREKDWNTLAEVLETRAAGEGDSKERVKVLTKLGALYGEQIKDQERAADAWKRVLTLDPKNGRALRTLRESFVTARDWAGLTDLYGDQGDYEGLAEVLGNVAERESDPTARVDLSLRAASVYEDRIGEPHRAFRNYERVLAVDPKNARAARSLIQIYEKDEKWARLPVLYEVLLANLPVDAIAERLELLERLRSLSAERLNDPQTAFKHALEAYRIAPEQDDVRSRLFAAAERANAWDRLVAALTTRLPQESGSNELELRRTIAKLARERLKDIGRAVEHLKVVVSKDASDTESANTLERIYRQAGRWRELASLLAEQVKRSNSDAQKWTLLRELAKIEETELNDLELAARYWQEALEIDARDKDALAALDRLHERAERWTELSKILEQRRRLTENENEKLSLSLRISELLVHREGDPERALSELEDLLSAKPDHRGAIALLESLVGKHPRVLPRASRILERSYEATHEWSKLRDAISRRMATETDPVERRALRLRFAELSATRVDDPSSAYATLEGAFLDDPSEPSIWNALAAAADRAGKHEALANAIETVIEAGEVDDNDVQRLREKLASLYDDVLGQPERAEAMHRRILTRDPLNEQSFLSLKELYTDAERWDDLQLLYRSRIAETVDGQAKLDLLLQVCFLFEELIDDPSLAIDAYRDVLALDPDHHASRRALERLFARTQRHRDLAALLEQELSNASGDEALELTFRLAEIHELKLNEPNEALDRYESVLSGDSDHDGARIALARLLANTTPADPTDSPRDRIAHILAPIYEARREWASLTRILEIQLERVEDASARRDLLVRIAELSENRLADNAAALSAWSRAVLCDPRDAHARGELARVATMQRAQNERALVLERAASGSADAPEVAIDLLWELATLWEDEVGEQLRAEDVYLRLVQTAEGDADTIRRASLRLERIHTARGDQPKLALDIRRQIDVEDDVPKKRALLTRLAALQEERLADTKAAIATHRERLELDPADRDALAALERLYVRGEAWEPLIEILSAQEANATSDERRAALSRRIGSIWDEKLRDHERAIDVYADVVERFGPDHESLAALTRLYEQAERWEELLRVVELVRDLVPGRAEKAQLRFHAAELMRKRTGEIERSIEAYAEVLEAAPGHEGATAALREVATDAESPLRFSAARVLWPRFEASSDSSAHLELLDVLAESDDPAERLSALRQAAQVAESGRAGGIARDPARAFDYAARAVRAALSEPEAPVLFADLHRLAQASGRHADYAALLRDVAPDVSNPDLQIQVLFEVAETARRELGEPELARQFYGRILEHQPDHRVALDALEEMTSAAGDHAALLDVLRRKAELAQGRDRVALLLRQAEISERHQGDMLSAIEALENALLEDPNQTAAYSSLERLYTGASRWDDLSTLYERMLEMRVGFPVEIRYRLGRVNRQHLRDEERAIHHFREALSLGAPHEPTIEELENFMRDSEQLRAEAAVILEPIYHSRLEWPKVVQALEARLSSEMDIEERKQLLERLGQVHEEYLEDLDGAMTVYSRLFAEDVRDQGTWETLARLAKVLEQWERLADVYRSAIEETGIDDPDLARLATSAAQIYDQRAGNASRAIELYHKVLEFSPDDRAVFVALESLLQRTAATDELLELYERQLGNAADDDERVELFVKTATVLRDKKQDSARAADTYREILAIEPTHREATLALDALLTDSERWSDLADHLRHRIDHEENPRELESLKHRLGVLLAERLDDASRAIDLFEEVTQADPHHQGSVGALEKLVTDADHQARIIGILEPIYKATDQWKKRIAIGEASLPFEPDVQEKVRRLREIAELHERRGQQLEHAFRALARAFAFDPENVEVREEVDRVAALRESWEDQVLAYEAAINESRDPALTSQLLSTVARLHDERRGDPRSAIETYERLAEHDPEDPTPLDALEALHTMVGDWAGLVGVLRRKVERSYDSRERGELLRRAGSVMEDLLGSRTGAIEMYRQATSEDPEDVIALESLDRLYSDANDFPALADVLRRRTELEADPDLRAELGLRLGALAEEALRDPDTAISALVRVLEDRPMEPTAIVSLARLYERQGMWSELLDNLRSQAAAAPDTTTRIGLLHRAATVLESDLDDPREALEVLRDLLERDPNYEPAIESLLRLVKLEDHRDQAAEIALPLLRTQQRYDALTEVLELMALGASDPIDRIAILRELARVQREGRRDLEAAFEAERRALLEDPVELTVADALDQLAEQLGNWERFADVLSLRAGTVTDPETSRELYARVAQVAEGRLKDDARAIEAHRRALEQSPDDAPALEALDRLYQKQRAWDELADVLTRRIGIAATDEERVELFVRLGTLERDQRSDRERAFTSFAEALELRADEPRVRAALEDMLAFEDVAPRAIEALDAAYRASGDLSKMGGLYDVRVRLSEDPASQVALLIERARMEEEELRDSAAALSTSIRAFQIDPRDATLLDDIERLAGTAGRWDSLAGLVERATDESVGLDSTTRRDLELRAASWYRDRLGDLPAAERALRRSIAIDREQSDAHRQLIDLLRQADRPLDLATALADWASAEFDELAKKEKLFEAAEILENKVADARAAGRLYEAVLSVDAADERALDALIRIEMAEARWPAVVDFLARRIEVESDSERRVQLRTQLAHVLTGPAFDLAQAVRAWEAVLEETPSDLAAIEQLEALYERAEHWESLQRVLERRLDIAETAQERVSARIRLARLEETRFGRTREAIAQFEGILDDDPRHPEVWNELERLYRADGRIDDLAALLERSIDLAVQSGDVIAEAAALEKLASTREAGGQNESAIEAYRRVLERDPARTGALWAIARLERSAGNVAEAAEVLERLSRQLPKQEGKGAALELAELAATSMNDPARAERSLRRALELDPADLAVRQRLISAYEANSSWAELAELLLSFEAEITDKKQRVAVLRRIAELQTKHLGDGAGAMSALERAVALEPDNRDILLPLVELYIAAGRQAEAIPVLEKIIASYGTRRSKEIAQYQHRLGQALEGLGDRAAALAAYDAAFKIDLTSVPILRDLGRLSWEAGDFERAQKTFRALLLQKLDPQAGISKADVYFYLGDISVKQGDPKKAMSMLDRAIAEDANHVRARELLTSLKT